MKKKIISIVVIIICIPVMLYGFRMELAQAFYMVFGEQTELKELTGEQKIEDFLYFYNTIVQSVPFLDDVKSLYGIDFVQRKEYYLQQVSRTSSNYEFYGVMKAIAQDVVSYHTNVVLPTYEDIWALNCYHSDEVQNIPGIEEKIACWENIFKESAVLYEDIDWFDVCYVDGRYLVRDRELPECYRELADCELLSVDGVDAREYLLQNISIYNIYYDEKHAQAYRELWTFNESVGKEVEAVFADKDGDELTRKLYVDIGLDLASSYGDLSTGKDSGQRKESYIQTYQDDENKLNYIKINGFPGEDDAFLYEYLKSTKYQKLVIDLRDNHGGLIRFAQRNMYPALYQENLNMEYTWRVPATKENRKMTHRLSSFLYYYKGKDKENFYYHNVLKFKGEATEAKEIYYLTGPETGSAADTYIAFIKKNNLGTIVGADTGGEGLGASFICDSLKHSSLVFIYYPSVAMDDSVVYPCKGTSPDVLINQSVADYRLEEKFRNEGIWKNYESRLQYDTVLKWVAKQ